MDQAALGAVVGAVATLITALLGKEALGKWLLSGQNREATAQTAIISLAEAAIAGWREASTAVVRLTEVVQGHDRDAAYQYQDLKARLDQQVLRLDEVDNRLATLVAILGGGREQE